MSLERRTIRLACIAGAEHFMPLASQGFQQPDRNSCADDASAPTTHIRLKIDPRVKRVPWDYVSGYAEKLKAGGLEVMSRRFDAEDHFLFFRQRAEVLQLVARWIGADSMKRTPTPR